MIVRGQIIRPPSDFSFTVLHEPGIVMFIVEMCDTFPRLKVIIRIVTIAKVVVLLPRSLAALGQVKSWECFSISFSHGEISYGKRSIDGDLPTVRLYSFGPGHPTSTSGCLRGGIRPGEQLTVGCWGISASASGCCP